jgi:hypothetical protein
MYKMNTNVTLSDFLMAHANVLSINSDGEAHFSTSTCESQIKEIVLSIFRAPHSITAVKEAIPPLIPGQQYTVLQTQNVHRPQGVMLASESENKAPVCLSLMEFINNFHDQNLPEFECASKEKESELEALA